MSTKTNYPNIIPTLSAGRQSHTIDIPVQNDVLQKNVCRCYDDPDSYILYANKDKAWYYKFPKLDFFSSPVGHYLRLPDINHIVMHHTSGATSAITYAEWLGFFADKVFAGYTAQQCKTRLNKLNLKKQRVISISETMHNRVHCNEESVEIRFTRNGERTNFWTAVFPNQQHDRHYMDNSITYRHYIDQSVMIYDPKGVRQEDWTWDEFADEMAASRQTYHHKNGTSAYRNGKAVVK